MRPLHIVSLLDHSDHHADKLCRCGPEPVRDLAEPNRIAYLHRRPMPFPFDEDAGARERREVDHSAGHRPGVLTPERQEIR